MIGLMSSLNDGAPLSWLTAAMTPSSASALEWGILAALSIAALVQVALWTQWLIPGVARNEEHSALAIDVWMPIVIVLPALGLGVHVSYSIGQDAWFIVGGPTYLGAIGFGLTLLLGRCLLDRWLLNSNRFLAIFWPLTGATLLLLAAAHELTVWVGQALFAVGAVLMWINTPDSEALKAAHATNDPARSRAGLALFLIILVAAGELALLSMLGDSVRLLGAATCLVQGVALIAIAACMLPGRSAARLSMWAATYGVLFGLGSLSLLTMAPRAITLATGGGDGLGTAPVLDVAAGFGPYAWEGAMLCMVGLIPLLAGQIDRRVVRVIGLLVILYAGGLLAWRILDACRSVL